MSLEDYVHNLFPPPDVHNGMDASVQWLDASGKWLVTISEFDKVDSGDIRLGPVWQGHYGDLEAGTGYQALMLGLSDWRQAR